MTQLLLILSNSINKIINWGFIYQLIWEWFCGCKAVGFYLPVKDSLPDLSWVTLNLETLKAVSGSVSCSEPISRSVFGKPIRFAESSAIPKTFHPVAPAHIIIQRAHRKISHWNPLFFGSRRVVNIRKPYFLYHI